MDKKNIRVLVVDDSAIVRNLLVSRLSKVEGIEVVGSAYDPYAARDKIVELDPDVLTLDVEMPRMDGITFLEKLMSYHPMPVIILSSLTPAGCDTAIKALELGAVEVMQKPSTNVSYELNEMIISLADKIKAASEAKYKLVSKKKEGAQKDNRVNIDTSGAMIATTDKIVAIGASTGGTEAIKSILTLLPKTFPGIVIVQHMPENFTSAFANRLNEVSKMEVCEAKNGDTVRQGLVLIARGNYHMLLKRSGARYYVELKQGPFVCNQRPSVDVLFSSVAKYAGRNSLGVILTGMGNDGSSGLLQMKEAGAWTLAQDEDSCVVYGMPKEAVGLNAVSKVLPLCDIPEALIRHLSA